MYEYTVDDPESFTDTWAAVIPMKRTDQPMFEYACHEGNYSMFTMLEGAPRRRAGKCGPRAIEPAMTGGRSGPSCFERPELAAGAEDGRRSITEHCAGVFP